MNDEKTRDEQQLEAILSEFEQFMEEIESADTPEKLKQFMKQSPQKYWEVLRELTPQELAQVNNELAQYRVLFTPDGLYIDTELVYPAPTRQ